jgi:Zn-dependent M28 family amino/carboxypeptidase
MIGAHLDSVETGPGINDNGSGSATVLEIALQLPQSTKNKVRFAFWGAEEMGLLGSYYYAMESQDLDDIALYLNFDMIGSPNFNRMYYTPIGPAEELIVETAWLPYFESRNLSAISLDLSGRTDHYPFQLEGVPTGGLFTGAKALKTEEEAALFGGTAGVALDHCYHRSCDTVDNVNMQVLEELSDAAAQAVLLFANRNNSDLMHNRSLVDPTAQPTKEDDGRRFLRRSRLDVLNHNVKKRLI